MMINNKKILFNFSSSYTGGGLKRLISFSEWFDSHGGAVFIVHEKSKLHLLKYKNNTYFYINLSKFKKALNSHKYLIDIVSEVEDKSLKMNLKDSVSPVLIEDVSDKNSYYVIMPMKI